MKQCNQCGVNIRGNINACPLCHAPLTGGDQDAHESIYPEFSLNVHKYNVISRTFLALSVAFGVISIAINIFTYKSVLWSAILVAAILYTWVVIVRSVMHGINIASKILEVTIFGSVLAVVIDVALGYSGWSVNYAVPELIIVSNVGILVLMAFNRMNWHDYVMYQISLMLLAFIPLILYFCGIIVEPAATIIAAVLSVAAFVSTILLGDKSVKSELKRRFHL